jgi:putative aldouronate transport system permease protein
MFKKRTPWFLHIIFLITTLLAVFPLLLVVVISFTDEKTIQLNGYSLFPQKLSLYAYQYLTNDLDQIIRSYLVTIFVTVVGTLISLIITTAFAYPLSRPNLPFKKGLTFFVFFTLLFNGGLVPWYIVFTNVVDLRNSLTALIIPNLLMSGFNVLIMRTYFINSIPLSLIESAYIDGAGELRIFAKIVIPLSKPVLATIGLFSTLAYWNDWYNSMVFLSSSTNFSIQFYLNRVLMSIQYLTQGNFNQNVSNSLNMLPEQTVRMAMAIIGVGPIIFAYPFFQKFFVKGLTIGAIKG